MEFSKKDTLEFIELYCKKSLLWDLKNPNHYNKMRKEDAWQEIAQEMKRSVHQCKKKMEYLLAALRREKMKMKKSIHAGKETQEVYKSSWFAFESMRFIWDRKPRRTMNTAINEQADESTEILVKGEKINSSVAKLQNKSPDPGTDSLQYPQSECSQLCKKRLNSSVDQRLDKAFRILTTSAHQLNDESYHFGNLVASKLRSYDKNIRHIIQSDIMEIFTKANRGYYSNFNNHSNHVFQRSPTAHPDNPTTSKATTFRSSQTSNIHTSEIQTSLSSPNESSSTSDDFPI
ncbi:hypothetical protein WN51_06752 [Melipona quadrifasciata]|uniref:MADF domain-containing protein n=1 Tax=Melipona quadrifasciata TaxID=166423 RepID=A0A0N0U3F6_9HYME|nr:hypothetical protein WN51_06752 [Melipona quadrifasciata]